MSEGKESDKSLKALRRAQKLESLYILEDMISEES